MKNQLILFLFISISFFVEGQDNHHWSEVYGMKASDLECSAFFRLEDNSEVYYNPAAIVFSESDGPNLEENE